MVSPLLSGDSTDHTFEELLEEHQVKKKEEAADAEESSNTDEEKLVHMQAHLQTATQMVTEASDMLRSFNKRHYNAMEKVGESIKRQCLEANV